MASPVQNLPKCNLCTTEIKPKQNQKTSCGHEFHFQCIDLWLDQLKAQEIKLSCPLCNHVIEPLASDQAIAPALHLLVPQSLDSELDLEYAAQRESAFTFEPEPLINKQDFILETNKQEVVLAAIRQNGLALQYASEALRNDREIVLAAFMSSDEDDSDSDEDDDIYN
jgi:hypothetical protein